MKKNILAIKSLLLLPLVATSFTLTMEQQKAPLSKRQRKQLRQAQQQSQYKVTNQNNTTPTKPIQSPRSAKLQLIEAHPIETTTTVPNIMLNSITFPTLKTYPTIITENNSVTTKTQPKYLVSDEQIVENGRKLFEELQASCAKISQLNAIKTTSDYHTIETNIIDLNTVPEAEINQTNVTTHEAKIDYEEFPFLVSTLETNGNLSITSVESSKTMENVPSELFQSVMLPTEEKGLGFFGSLSYYMKDSIKTIISYLQNNTFETDNASHFKWLNEAIQQAIARNDFDSLATIAALCNENETYKDKIRISHDTAQASFNFFQTKYTQEIAQSNDTIQNKHKNYILDYNAKTIAFSKYLSQAVDKYNQEMNNIANSYSTEAEKEIKRIADMQKQIASFSVLHASIRENTETLLTQHHLEIPNNKCAKQIDKSQNSLNSVLKLSNNISTIKEPKRLLTNSLQLNSK